ncbi:unnamed protein product [Pocillopora meandrina]|uniref:Uncharacterized protein n=1 Tax=Pocillopora meandrina TaxID=46732 RepID=A0AAU9XGH3_9CNID|nr:unnamed protein product [Pocillopora meandrina]
MPAAEEETQLSTVTMVRPVGRGGDISPVAGEGEEAVGVVVKMEEREDQLETLVPMLGVGSVVLPRRTWWQWRKCREWPPNQAPHCYDKSASGGNAGSSSSGGGGGDSCGNHYGGGGGGGGLQFGNTNFTTHLSYGGGGGGGGASAFSDDPNPGGKGGSGGGLVYLQVGKLVLQGTISVKGNSGQCLNRKGHRSAPGGSGAGGSVVIFTKKLIGDPKTKISVSGGDPVKCAFGTGGGKQTKSFANHAVRTA